MNTRKQARQQRAYDRLISSIGWLTFRLSNLPENKRANVQRSLDAAIQQRDNLRKKGFVSSPGIPVWEINS